MSATHSLGTSLSALSLTSWAMKGGPLTSVRLGLFIHKVGTEVIPTSKDGHEDVKSGHLCRVVRPVAGHVMSTIY